MSWNALVSGNICTYISSFTSTNKFVVGLNRHWLYLSFTKSTKSIRSPHFRRFSHICSCCVASTTQSDIGQPHFSVAYYLLWDLYPRTNNKYGMSRSFWYVPHHTSLAQTPEIKSTPACRQELTLDSRRQRYEKYCPDSVVCIPFQPVSDPSHKYALIPTELQHENQEATFTGATLLHRASIHPHESIIIKSAKRRTLYFRTISMQRVPQDGTRHLGTLTPFTETSLSTPDKLTRPPRASSTEAGIPMCTCGLEEKMERGGKRMIPVVHTLPNPHKLPKWKPNHEFNELYDP